MNRRYYLKVLDGLHQFLYNDGMLLSGSQTLYGDLAVASMGLSYAAYNYDKLEDAYEDMGYEIVGGGRPLYEVSCASPVRGMAIGSMGRF